MAISDHHRAAEEYLQAPIFDIVAAPAWVVLAREVGRLYQHVCSKGLAIEKTPFEPYASFSDMCDDLQRGRFRRTTDEDPHPLWDPETQWRFRVVHDYFHVVSGLDFTVEGELAICHQHLRVMDRAAWPALVTEIYGQAAYSMVYGAYAQPKVFLSTIQPPEGR